VSIDASQPFLYCEIMTHQIISLCRANLWMLLRDRILYAVLGVAVVMLFMVPSLSSFSMRQVQELAITLSLSTVSAVLLVVTLLLGSSSVWRDIERRYTASILTLPVSRDSYLLAKFISIGLFIILTGIMLALASASMIALAATQYPSDIPLAWGNILLAIGADITKYILLASLTVLFSAVSTSFFLPFFVTLAIYLAGSASQEVYEYVSGQFATQIAPLQVNAIKAVYYLLPNFAAFNFKVHAVYALPVGAETILFPLGYAIIYGGVVLCAAIWAFNRRELP
jgi:ABC-type transport system involved in multi-copper enzyme maturation permease subunit